MYLCFCEFLSCLFLMRWFVSVCITSFVIHTTTTSRNSISSSKKIGNWKTTVKKWIKRSIYDIWECVEEENSQEMEAWQLWQREDEASVFSRYVHVYACYSYPSREGCYGTRKRRKEIGRGKRRRRWEAKDKWTVPFLVYYVFLYQNCFLFCRILKVTLNLRGENINRKKYWAVLMAMVQRSRKKCRVYRFSTTLFSTKIYEDFFFLCLIRQTVSVGKSTQLKRWLDRTVLLLIFEDESNK